MNLSNRLTFSLVFSVLLIAAIAFVATPAMAQIVTVSAEVKEVVAPVTTPAKDIKQAKRVVEIKYSVAANPAPKLADFTTNGTEPLADTVGEGNTVALTGSGTTFTLTFKGKADGTSEPTVDDVTLPGYDTVTISGGVAGPVFFRLESGTLAGHGYIIIAQVHVTDSPTLPASVATEARRNWADHAGDVNGQGLDDSGDNPAMPDLEALLGTDGGTISLKLVAGTNAKTTKADDTPLAGDDLLAARNAKIGDARDLVINEIMWAHNNNQIGQDALIEQQWIEIYNRRTTPVPLASIRLYTSKVFPAPAAQTDRVSTIPSFIAANNWSISGKGQSGKIAADDGTGGVDFVSMAKNKDDQNKDGSTAAHWAAAERYYLPGFKGSPGAVNSPASLSDRETRMAPSKTVPPKSKIVINEIGKSANEDANADWIELKNMTAAVQSLKGYSLTLTTGIGNETVIVGFADADSIPADGYLLLLNSQPETNKHIRGFDIRVAAIDQLSFRGITESSHHYLVLDDEIQIPAADKWLLILRSNKDDKFLQSSHNIHDVAGPGGGHANFVVQDLNAADPKKDKNAKGDTNKGSIWDTRVWPLNGQNAASKGNFLRHDKADGDDSIALGGDDAVWTRDTSKQGFAHGAFGGKVGYTGVGYDRGAATIAENGGTPGFPNDTIKSKLADVGGSLIVSELMLNNDGGKSPQWIELKNTSKTHGISFGDPDGDKPLKEWTIEIENHNSGTWDTEVRKLNVTVKLSDLFVNVPPDQTLLIVSTKVRGTSMSDPLHFPNHRVASIEEKAKVKAAFGLAGRKDIFLNAEGGFTITIKDSAGQVSDMVGNLDGLASNPRAGIGLDDPFGWNWSTDMAEDGSRTSLLRLKNDDGTPRPGTPIRDDPATADVDETDELRGSVMPLGNNNRGAMSKAAWVHAVDTAGDASVQITYYGDEDDYGTPLYSTGAALPVSLSYFRPTLENGEVVIRWTTESELDNAGFNILRGDSRDGEFKQVNSELVQGAGTTGERNTYKLIDESAKPGVIYYYQIEDVSFAGEHQTLTTTKLKGLISAKNKLTTLWGGLKEVQ